MECDDQKDERQVREDEMVDGSAVLDHITQYVVRLRE